MRWSSWLQLAGQLPVAVASGAYRCGWGRTSLFGGCTGEPKTSMRYKPLTHLLLLCVEIMHANKAIKKGLVDKHGGACSGFLLGVWGRASDSVLKCTLLLDLREKGPIHFVEETERPELRARACLIVVRITRNIVPGKEPVFVCEFTPYEAGTTYSRCHSIETIMPRGLPIASRFMVFDCAFVW